MSHFVFYILIITIIIRLASFVYRKQFNSCICYVRSVRSGRKIHSTKIWTRSLNEQQIEKFDKKFTTYKLNIAIMIDYVVLLSCIVQFRKQIRAWKNWKFENKVANANHLDAIKNLNKNFDHSILLIFSATNVNHFEFSIIHNNNDKSRISKRLKKFAQLVEISKYNEFFTFKSYLKKRFENNDCNRFVFRSKYQKHR